MEVIGQNDLNDVVYLSNRLVGQDGRLDQLFNLFEQLQLATVETAHLSLDLLSFAEKAYFFAVILKERSSAPGGRQPTNLSFTSMKKQRNLNKQQPEEESSKKRPREAEGSDVSQSPLDPLQPKIRKLEADNDSPNSQVFQRVPRLLRSPLGWYNYSLAYDAAKAEHNHAIATALDDLPQRNQEAIGLVYLTPLNVLPDDPLHVRELNIGIVLEPEHQGKGYAQQVIGMVLRKAFQEAQCHRVQAILPDRVAKDRAICLFTHMRFDFEGIRRRAFFSPIEKVFKDVTYMAMVDTDWALRVRDGICDKGTRRPAPKSVWDELFARHQREREELLDWESGVRSKRSVTLVRAQTPTQSDFRGVSQDVQDSDMEGEGFSLEKGKEKERAGWELDLDYSSEGEVVVFPPKSEYESEADSVRSVSPGGYVSAASSPSGYDSAASSASSAWDVVEPSESESESSGLAVSSDSVDDAAMYDFVRRGQ